MKKGANPLDFQGIAPATRHYPMLQKITKLSQTAPIRVPNDDMVEHIDLHQLASANEVPRRFDVAFRWRRIAGRMIVHQHDRRGAGDDCHTEHLAWMHEERVHRANSHQLVAFYPSAGI